MLENSLSASKYVPREFSLHKPYPNPFNNTISIPMTKSIRSDVVIEIFDISGRKIETIFNGQLQPGKKDFQWNANKASSGVYLIHSLINGESSYEKIMLIK